MQRHGSAIRWISIISSQKHILLSFSFPSLSLQLVFPENFAGNSQSIGFSLQL